MSKTTINVTLVGFPNSGKTTLYNWLTGSNFKTVNYPGSTVEYAVGDLIKNYADQIKNKEIKFIDTPGTYSFNPQSMDEEITKKIISNETDLVSDLVLLVIDGTQLSRQLPLAKSLIDAQVPFKIVLTMSDLLKKSHQSIQIEKMKEALGCDVMLFDGVLAQGLNEIVQCVSQANQIEKKEIRVFSAWSKELDLENARWSEQILERTNYSKQAGSFLKQTLMIDNVLMHPFFGYIIFFMVMTFIFASIYWFAAPFMDGIEALFGWFSEKITEFVPGLFGQFLSEGMIPALGGIAVFVPQIFILFIFIHILESSGYLSRVAALIDKPMSMIGLGGRSFVPVLSGFACAIPALIATRNISSKKEKLIAQAMIPLLTCSARIPVFSLIIGFLIGGDKPLLAGFCMALLYFVSLLIGALASGILSRLIIADQKSKLLMDLPIYRLPKFKVTFRYGYDRAKSFIKNAGPIIFVLSIVIWVATTFPRHQVDEGNAQAIAQHSYAAQLGKIVEPVFKPMGLDWRVGFGIMTAFAAREVFVSSLVLMFNAEGNDEDAQTVNLIDKMKEAKMEDGTPIFTLGSSIGLLLFFMVAMQCMATFAILKKETGGYKLAVTFLVVSNTVAYLLAVTANYLFRLIA